MKNISKEPDRIQENIQEEKALEKCKISEKEPEEKVSLKNLDDDDDLLNTDIKVLKSSQETKFENLFQKKSSNKPKKMGSPGRKSNGTNGVTKNQKKISSFFVKK